MNRLKESCSHTNGASSSCTMRSRNSVSSYRCDPIPTPAYGSPAHTVGEPRRPLTAHCGTARSTGPAISQAHHRRGNSCTKLWNVTGGADDHHRQIFQEEHRANRNRKDRGRTTRPARGNHLVDQLRTG